MLSTSFQLFFFYASQSGYSHLSRDAEDDRLLCVVSKEHDSVICYARLNIMKCEIQEKQIAIEGFLNLIENEGVL